MFSKNLRRFVSFAADQSAWKPPVRVALTGSTGNIGYATVFRIANGEMLGPDQPVILQLIDLPFAESALGSLKMELDDCAFPLVQEIITTTDQSVGFKDADYALLIGSKPRGKGQERNDLIAENGRIFVDTGKAINDNASRDLKTLVVGNPANTNSLICSHYAPEIPDANFHAMTRLDHDRALSQLSYKLGVPTYAIQNFMIWGNHSSTMYPDTHHATANGELIFPQLSQQYIDDELLPTVQQRGAAIIKARGLSSAASAGNAAISHVRDWVTGTNGQWTSFAVPTDGSYGVPEGLVFSFPVTAEAGSYSIVQGIEISEEAQRRIDITTEELLAERRAVEDLL